MSACIVTGCAAGNGAAIAEFLRNDGHLVVGVDLRCSTLADNDWVIEGDILSPSIQDLAFEKALSLSDGELFLINNAGVTTHDFPQTDEVWNLTVDVNLKAPFQWSRRFAKHVQSAQIKSGGIVFIGSLATTMGFPKNPAYQASKSGITGLARAFAYDLGPFGIRSNCVSPGYIQTAMTRTSFETPELNDARKKHMLLKRWGQPEDVANAVSFLCSTRSEYITGINLPVDGGWMICGLSS